MVSGRFGQQLCASAVLPIHHVHIPTKIPLSRKEIELLLQQSQRKGILIDSPIQKMKLGLNGLINNEYLRHFKKYTTNFSDILRVSSSTFCIVNQFEKKYGTSLTDSGKKLLNINDDDPDHLAFFGNGVLVNDDAFALKESQIAITSAHNQAKYINEDGLRTNRGDQRIVYKQFSLPYIHFYDGSGSGNFIMTTSEPIFEDEDRDLAVIRLRDKLAGSEFLKICRTNQNDTYSERAISVAVNGGQVNVQKSIESSDILCILFIMCFSGK